MIRPRKAAWIAAVAALTLVSTPLWSADAPTGSASIGLIDQARLKTEAPKMKRYSDELQALAQSLDATLDLRNGNPMLDKAEIKELIDLKAKAAPTPAESARIEALSAAESAREQELKTLQSSRTLTDLQRMQMRGLQDRLKQSETAFNAAYQDGQNKLTAKSEELEGKASADLAAAATKVAVARKLKIVLLTNTVLPDGGTRQIALYGGVDVTDDVIAQLAR